MTPSFHYHSFHKARVIEDVKNQLQELNDELTGSDMENLIAFNNTYFIITKNVYAKLGTNYFQDDDLMKKIDTTFGNYYFDALHNYVQRLRCAPAWKILFDTCLKNQNFQFIYMALGVNAHVNNDLGQTLKDVMKGDMFDADFLIINQVIKDSLLEVVSSLHEKDTILDTSKDILEPAYALLLNQIIQKWRNDAWDIYHQLYWKKLRISEIETAAEEKATHLAGVKSLLNISQILESI